MWRVLILRRRGRGPWWHNRFEDFGVRVTEPREVVMEVLLGTEEHLTAADIYVRAHELNPAIGLTTVYRTLDILLQMGIVQKFDFGEGKARYELINNSQSKEHHHHLVCVRCKTIVDYYDFVDEELEFIKKTQDKLSDKYRFHIMDHVISFYGICEKCRMKSQE